MLVVRVFCFLSAITLSMPVFAEKFIGENTDFRVPYPKAICSNLFRQFAPQFENDRSDAPWDLLGRVIESIDTVSDVSRIERRVPLTLPGDEIGYKTMVFSTNDAKMGGHRAFRGGNYGLSPSPWLPSTPARDMKAFLSDLKNRRYLPRNQTLFEVMKLRPAASRIVENHRMKATTVRGVVEIWHILNAISTFESHQLGFLQTQSQRFGASKVVMASALLSALAWVHPDIRDTMLSSWSTGGMVAAKFLTVLPGFFPVGWFMHQAEARERAVAQNGHEILPNYQFRDRVFQMQEKLHGVYRGEADGCAIVYSIQGPRERTTIVFEVKKGEAMFGVFREQ